jgi:prolyl-tRNA editing enzyme YbaK/EbsC (Cys-tRNA(Pro) deacylase)
MIAEQGIAAQLIRDIGDTPTVPAAASALGVEADRIIKTLLFLVQLPGEGTNRSQPLLVISCGEHRVDHRSLADHMGVGKKRVKLAPPAVVLELLGYPAGGVPPFGHRTTLPVLLDEALLRFAGDATIYGGGGDDVTMLALTVDELLRVVEPTILPLSEA